MKYIDAERLKTKLDEHYRKYQSEYMETWAPYTRGLIDALNLAEQVIDSLRQEQPVVGLGEELKDIVARGAAGQWCRCFKCDGIINTTGGECDKENLLTCPQRYDGYRTALLALGDHRIFNARKEE